MNARTLLGTLAAAMPATLAASGPTPIFGDWWYHMPEGWRDIGNPRGTDPCDAVPWYPLDAETTFIPINPTGGGHGGPTYQEGSWMAWYAMCVAQQFEQRGLPIALMIRNRNCPFPYAAGGATVNPDALQLALDNLPRLDYILMDLENWGTNGWEMVRLNSAEIVRMVRSHPNPRVANAFIGNYSDWAGERDEAQIFRSSRSRRAFRTGPDQYWDRAQFYYDHFNISMPVAYPYQSYSRHAEPIFQRQENTPNNRSAISWAPLERVSEAARSLPQGHVLMPWVTPYSPVLGNALYNAAPPTPQDLEANIQHFRMRGALSFMIWTPSESSTHHPQINYQDFRTLTMDAWGMISPIFESAEKVEFLNLTTDKRSGLQWSGVRAADRVWILASNLHEYSHLAVNLPAIEGLPEQTPPIPPGAHVLLSYTVDPAVRDFNGDGVINAADYMRFATSLSDTSASGLSGWGNSVGGRGADPRDINGDGVIDLIDLLAVCRAYVGGAYGPTNDNRGSNSYNQPAKAPTGRGTVSRADAQ